MSKLYQQIADKIVIAMENGVRPWEECYSVTRSGFAKRVTGDDYRGINRLLLTFAMIEKDYQCPVWMTFNQAKKLGGGVRKGEKASLSLFFKPLETTDEETGEDKTIPIARTNMVFNVEQIDGLPEDFMDKHNATPKHYDNNPLERAEAFIKATKANVIHKDGTPSYKPSTDEIFMPAINQFKTAEQYYATYLHELAHWTAHRDRLNRPILSEFSRVNYSKEELCAELTAAFLCPSIGVKPLIDEEHAPYLAGYIKLLKDEPGAFITACSQAEKAADYLRGLQADE